MWSYWFENILTFAGIVLAILVFGIAMSLGAHFEAGTAVFLGAVLFKMLVKNIAEEVGYSGRASC